MQNRDFKVRELKIEDLDGALSSFEQVASERIYLGTEEVNDRTRQRWLESWADDGKRNLFAVAESEGKIIGGIVLTSLFSPKSDHVRNLGMWVLKDHRGKGVGKALMKYAFSWARRRGDIKRITLEVYASNTSAVNMYTKNGFVFEGVFRNNAVIDGQYVDEIAMALEL